LFLEKEVESPTAVGNPLLEFSPEPAQIAEAEKLNRGGFKKTTE
tara:strand:+ start:1735 stop:1866 length:132 start_codon:yes stop_codon:yes gene_type:complete